MARDNYSYQKFRREQLKKKKKEEKIQRKLDKKKELLSGEQGSVPTEGVGTDPGPQVL